MDSRTRDALVALVLAGLVTWAIVTWGRNRSGDASEEVSVEEPDRPRPTRPARREDLLALWGEGGASLQGLIRPALHVDLSPADEKTLRPGCSKMGGGPDLPEGVAAPSRAGRPLEFLAQIDLAELPATDPPHGLPAAGLLQFFYDVKDQPWGFDPADRGGAVVLYHENVASLRRAEGAPAFRARSAAFVPAAQWPGRDSIWIERLKLDAAMERRYDALLDRHADAFRTQGHQLLGYPFQIQNPMEEECQLASNGIYMGGDRPVDPARADALKKNADEWRLLFQVDSDDALGTSWGDAGMVYFWIRQPDLEARRFDRIWVILQCY